MHTRRFMTTAISVTTLLVGLAVAHDDDGKILDRQGPYVGPGFRLSGGGGGGGGERSDFESSRVKLFAWLPLGDFGKNIDNGNSCWGYVSPSGREYALMGLSSGTSFVEITDPGNPKIITTLAGPVSLWRDVKAYGHYAYAASEGGDGIQVFDMADIDNGNVTFVRNVTEGGTTATHTLLLNPDSGYLYRAGGGGNGLRIYDLNEDPATPKYVGAWSDKYTHEAQIINYTSGEYEGREIAFACGGLNSGWTDTGLDILDVTDKSKIVKLGWVSWPNAGYSHQIWVSDDRRYAYIDDELDEYYYGDKTRTIVIDISDLTKPTFAGDFTNGNPAIGHNLYVRGNRLFQANYRSGLRIFDISDPLNGKEIAWFDTFPDNDRPNFNGLWNNYPFFPSRTIIGSDIERGMFVWRVIDKGDLNCDSFVDFADIDGFVLALTDPEGYAQTYPDCGTDLGDINGNGSLDFDDIDPFVECLISGACPGT